MQIIVKFGTEEHYGPHRHAKFGPNGARGVDAPKLENHPFGSLSAVCCPSWSPV